MKKLCLLLAAALLVCALCACGSTSAASTDGAAAETDTAAETDDTSDAEAMAEESPIPEMWVNTAEHYEEYSADGTVAAVTDTVYEYDAEGRLLGYT